VSRECIYLKIIVCAKFQNSVPLFEGERKR
jgi:hypothetical protein